MYTWLRAASTIRSAGTGARVDAEAKTVLALRVLPTDIDGFGHLNNGRYLTLCDLGRFDLSIRCGMMGVFKAKGWHPVVGAATVRYRRSLELGHRFDLSSQLIYWDEKWFYIEHQFLREGDVYARVLIKGAVRSKDKKTVPMGTVIAALGQGERPAKPLPELIKSWGALDQQLR